MLVSLAAGAAAVAAWGRRPRSVDCASPPVWASEYRFPAIQTDLARNAYLVFSRSGADEHAQLRQTGRRVGDPANDLQNSALVRAGEGSYTRGRWGDYFGICRDGGDGSTVWMYGEYAGTGDTWATRVCAARFG